MLGIPLYIYQAINLLNAILSLLIGVFVLFRTRFSKIGKLFGLFAFCVFFWDIFYFLAFQFTDYALTAFLFRTCMIAGVLILPIFTEFVFAFVGKRTSFVFKLVNFGVAALIISTIYTKWYALDGGPFLVFYYWPIIGFMAAVQIFHYAVNVFVSERELINASRAGSSAFRQQARIIIVGTLLGYLGAASNFLLWFRIPFPPLLNVLIPIYVVSVAYAITKYRLMDIQVVIKKTAVYSILTMFITGLLISVVLLGERLFRGIFGYGSIWAIIIAAFIIALVFQPLRDLIQNLIDKLFFKKKYDYQKTLKDLSQSAINVVDVTQLLGFVIRTVKSVLQVSKVDVYLLDHQKEEFVLKGKE